VVGWVLQLWEKVFGWGRGLKERALNTVRRVPDEQEPGPLLRPLTPRYDPVRHAVYFRALDAELRSRNRPALNIALTGSYGVGKSSILEEVTRRHQHRVIPISLSTLGLTDEVNTAGEGVPTPAPATKTNRIQKEIVKQLLYSQDPVKMPGSRYRRMTRFRFWRQLGVAALFGLPTAVLFYLTGWTETLSKLVPLPADWSMLMHGVVLLAAVGLILGFQAAFHNRIQIEKITAGTATISLSAKSSTYFDEYLDEIVYFFEVVKRDVVVFEDIDRFDDPHIFETLRALNSILNGAKQLKRRQIRFVYAIKDSIFDELGARAAKEEVDEVDGRSAYGVLSDAAEAEVARANRTKFFDLVIPVVPFITHRSARDLIVETMRDVDPDLSTELVDLAARHVADMRLIKNIRNEYAIFKHQILDTGALELDHNKLFAMMLYKSTHLSDFELIKLGRSSLDELYRDSRNLVTSNVRALQAQIRRRRTERTKVTISSEQSESFGAALLDYVKIRLFELGAQEIRGFTLNQQQIPEPNLRTAEFWEDLAKGDSTLSVTFRHPNYGNFRVLELKAEDITKAVGERIRSRQWAIAKKKELDSEIHEAIAASRDFLPRATMRDLMLRDEFKLERNGAFLTFADLAKQRLKSELAEKLVSEGYIDRNFTLYTSTFHGARISANATNFILKNVEPNEIDMYFRLSGSDVDAIIRDKGLAILQERCVYNITLLDRLLETEAEQAGIITERLKRYDEEEREFILAYLEAGAQRKTLVCKFVRNWHLIFTVLIDDAQLDDATSVKLIDSAMLSLAPGLGYAISDAVKGFILTNYEKLEAFTGPATTSSQADRIAAFLSSAEIRLPRLELLGPEVLTRVVGLHGYDLTRENLLTSLDSNTHPLSLDAIAQTNSTIYQRILGDIESYLAVLHDSEPSMTGRDNFATIITEISESDPDQLAAVISRSAKACIVDALSAVPPASWPLLARELRFPATLANVRDYINVHELDGPLAKLLEFANRIDVGEDDSEDNKLEVALRVLRAKNELPSSRFRVNLVEGLQLKHYITFADIADEPGELLGHLLEADIVPDNSGTFDCVDAADVSGLIFAISKSQEFASFMTPDHIPPNVLAAVINSEIVPIAVKDAIVERLGEFTAAAPRSALAAVAGYALEGGKHLPLSYIDRLASEQVDGRLILALLQPHMPTIALAELAPVLASIGGKYALLAAKGRRPRIPNTSLDRALVDRLQALGWVRTVKFHGDEIQVNVRR
jgi:hypothetical protein